jgi:hypothetical protein
MAELAVPLDWESGQRWLGRAILRHLLALALAVVALSAVMELSDDPPPADVAVTGVVYGSVLLGLLALVTVALPSAFLLVLVSLGYRSPWLRPAAALVLTAPAALFALTQQPQEWFCWIPAAFQLLYALLLLPAPERTDAEGCHDRLEGDRRD